MLTFFIGVGIGSGGLFLFARPLIRSVDPGGSLFWLVGFVIIGWLIMWCIVLPFVARDFFIHCKLRSHLAEPRCIYCGYDLKGHTHTTTNHIRCPECGKDSPRLPPIEAQP